MRICRSYDDDRRPELRDCLAHRCEAHKDVPPLDDTAGDGAECGLCVGDQLANQYAQVFENVIFWPLIDTAVRRLDLLSQNAGQAFRMEVIARLEKTGELTEQALKREPAVAGMSQPDAAAQEVDRGTTDTHRRTRETDR